MHARFAQVWGLLVFSAACLLAQVSSVSTALRIDEEHIRLSLNAPPSLELPVFNETNRTIHAHLHLEVLQVDDKILKTSDEEISILPGNNTLASSWIMPVASDASSEIYWWRLRYRIDSTTSDGVAVQGIVQVGTIVSNWMRIEAVGPHHVKPGSTFTARIRVENFRTGKGLSSATVDASMTDTNGNSRSISTHPVKTDGQGYALLTLRLPTDADSDSSFEVTAHRGDVTAVKSLDLALRDRPNLTLSTDKPIYQPGQTLHMRVLAVRVAGHVAGNGSAKFSVENEDGETQFEQQTTTSKFGIAAADWEIPNRLRTGHYRVWVEMGDQRVASEIRISRYELPEFTVVPVTDKSYYLPGQQVRVDVEANYLFGQPVRRGTVRIVRERGTHWNSQTKKWEVEDEELKNGELDSSGKFKSVLDVQSDFDELKSADYERYRDLHFAAYVTDSSTNRTEQKSFTVRLSKEQIHLYVMNSPRAVKEPLSLYVTAAFPDGTPASVDVTVSAIRPDEDGDFPGEPGKPDQALIAHVHTNEYGIAHLQSRPLAQTLLVDTHSAGYSYSRARLMIEAHDKRGRHGVHCEQIWLWDDHYFHIRPVKRILQEGESIAAEIESSAPDQAIFIDLLGRDKVLDSKRVELHHGNAMVEFPYDPEFRDSLYLVAYNMTSTQDEAKRLSAGAEVLFPELQDLDLGVRLARTTYRPGEPATAEFRVRSPEGRPAESALGILVYDKAVAERVRADHDFGSYGFVWFDQNWNRYPTIAGITYRDLLNQKLTRPVAPGMELVAEAILSAMDDDQEWRMELQGNNDYERSPGDVFRSAVDRSLDRVQAILQANHASQYTYPSSGEEFRALLARNEIDFDHVRDPWGMPYFLNFRAEARDSVLEIRSSGPGKRPGTQDEFVAKRYSFPFFAAVGHLMDTVASDYARSTGDYIRDLPTLRLQLETRGINLHALRDLWGQPYSFSFDVAGPNYQIDVVSQGPPAPLGRKRRQEPLKIWRTSVHYFQQEARTIDRALAQHFQMTRQFPSSEAELKPVLDAAGIDISALRDPWGHPYHFEFMLASRYGNSIDMSVYDAGRKDKLVPVTQKVAWIYVYSYGRNHDPAQKFEVASFNQIVTEQSSRTHRSGRIVPVAWNGLSGAISGTVTDPAGAVVSNAKVSAIDEVSSARYETTTQSNGSYLLDNLPAGKYRVEVESPGFKASVIRFVPVTSSNSTKLDVTLTVGASAMTVEVTAAAPAVETATMQVSASKVSEALTRMQPQQQAFTPRLRKYFPETLVWRPELLTDSSGKAKLQFAMADNITSWKMSVIASNAEGRLGIVEKELRTFLPFFVDHEPPKILTQGDQIDLPVVLRNYMNKVQEVDVKLEPASWLELLNGGQQRVSVSAGENAAAHFLLSAAHSVREGKERVTASNHETGDAVEHSVSVHPDGQSVTQSVVEISSAERTTLALNIPRNAISGSIDAELKIFPNLAAHVLNSIEGMVARPAGCGEQITSIAFGSLLALQVLHKAGQDDPGLPANPNSELAKRARRYLNDAYEQLLTLQDSNGGFPYWLHHEPNLALTAYILDFLSQASQFIDVDRKVVLRARDFVVRAQNSDGSWSRQSYDGKLWQDPNLTGLIARSLADALGLTEERQGADPALNKALDFLTAHLEEWKDPYLVGQYALAAARGGRAKDADRARAALGSMAHEEGTALYWNLEANVSPFYGWGFAGRLETTGLAVQALARLVRMNHNPQEARLVNRGLFYLLAHKDPYGVWYSTHASVDVLRAIIEAIPEAAESGDGGTAAILVNDKPAGRLTLPPPNALSGPLSTDISSSLANGTNKIEVVRQEGSPIQAQIISTHYVPWSDAQAGVASSLDRGVSRSLRLSVIFDQTQSKIGKSIQCTVEAERIGFAGYGMMLAEIGLPPGADVDRASLQHLVDSFTVDQYDVLPDRVVFYIWPKAGGSKFIFSFKPRFAMNAAAAPSTLYDYYNPEAQATVVPVRFTVH